MNKSKALSKLPANTELDVSMERWTRATTDQTLTRAKDINRDKIRAVQSFFDLVVKQPDEVSSEDVLIWQRYLKGRDLSERYIYASLSHLSSYFEWLKALPEFAHFIKINPVRTVMPKPPKKYNSPKAKSLTDEELTKLWLYVEKQAEDDQNLIAVRDYAIFRFFTATGMRREEVINLGTEDIRLEENQIFIHTRVKGGNYEWRTINDEEVKAALERYLRLTKRKSTVGQKGRALWIRFDRAAEAAAIDRRIDNPLGDEPRLSSHSFDRQIKKYAEAAGIGHFHIHQFRHTFARIVAEESGSLIEAQEALGHKDIQTTQIYINRIKFKKDKHSRSLRDRVKPFETT
jgi:integrase/recombinase XerD